MIALMKKHEPQKRIVDRAFGIVPILEDHGEYLVLLIQHNAGHWAFPKGHQEPGETELQTAMREFEEETGIKDYEIARHISLTERYSFKYKKQRIDKEVVYFGAFVRQSTVKIQKSEIKDFRWVTLKDAIRLATFEEGRELIIALRKILTPADCEKA
jgi:8-oxo-dGTP pyrophosphatase MutT (NUDIX family)